MSGGGWGLGYVWHCRRQQSDSDMFRIVDGSSEIGVALASASVGRSYTGNDNTQSKRCCS